MSARISGGKQRGHRIRSGRGSGLRPTSEKVRAAIFSILGPDLEGARVLDCYAGTGALGLEALSRGAASADFIEADDRGCRDIRQALRELGMEEHGRVYKGKVERTVGRMTGRYDIVFADPPYDDDPWDELLTRFGYDGLLNEGATVVAEHRNKRVLNDRYGRLGVSSRRKYGDTAVTFFRWDGKDG
ncbi:MAG: 16S rRNA (guanine(966)-N(2))-methyltransferase RsmD [SAR202 cluster bacterium]|nr:16S rRNA (guanine(966)-N(2))-methyltransferase RsmD [SAR202 cluster bacterium]